MRRGGATRELGRHCACMPSCPAHKDAATVYLAPGPAQRQVAQPQDAALAHRPQLHSLHRRLPPGRKAA